MTLDSTQSTGYRLTPNYSACHPHLTEQTELVLSPRLPLGFPRVESYRCGTTNKPRTERCLQPRAVDQTAPRLGSAALALLPWVSRSARPVRHSPTADGPPGHSRLRRSATSERLRAISCFPSGLIVVAYRSGRKHPYPMTVEVLVGSS